MDETCHECEIQCEPLLCMYCWEQFCEHCIDAHETVCGADLLSQGEPTENVGR